MEWLHVIIISDALPQQWRHSIQELEVLAAYTCSKKYIQKLGFLHGFFSVEES